jgi:hypothetical protein
MAGKQHWKSRQYNNQYRQAITAASTMDTEQHGNCPRVWISLAAGPLQALSIAVAGIVIKALSRG